MTDVNYSYQDTTIHAFADFFNVHIDAQDLANMSAAEQKIFFENLIDQNQLSDTQIVDFETALKAEIKELDRSLRTYSKDLNKLLKSNELSSAEASNIEILLEEITAWTKIFNNSSGQVIKAWGDSLDDFDAKHLEMNSGDSYTFNPTDPQNGAVYNINVNADGVDTSGSAFNTAENADWLDLNHDGYRETNPDINGDGIADDDFNKNGAIDEGDLTFGNDFNTNTSVTLKLEDGDQLSLASYDAAADTAMFKITQEDGTIYYININNVLASGLNIFSATIPTNLNSMPDDLLAIMKEKSNSENTFYGHVHGSEPDAVDGEYYSIYDTSDFENNTLLIEPTEDDFKNGRDYTINCESNSPDEIDIDLSKYGFDDADITFNSDADGNLVLTATTDSGSITFTFKGLEFSLTNQTNADLISVTGGQIDINAANASALWDHLVQDTENGDPWHGALFGIIFMDEQSLLDRYVAGGFNPQIFQGDEPPAWFQNVMTKLRV